jgi:hypothetical protein
LHIDEAKTKWCPFGYTGGINLRGIPIDGPTLDEKPGHYPEYNCIADKCMMWRRIDKEDGFCGLAPTRYGGFG